MDNQGSQQGHLQIAQNTKILFGILIGLLFLILILLLIVMITGPRTVYKRETIHIHHPATNDQEDDPRTLHVHHHIPQREPLHVHHHIPEPKHKPAPVHIHHHEGEIEQEIQNLHVHNHPKQPPKSPDIHIHNIDEFETEINQVNINQAPPPPPKKPIHKKQKKPSPPPKPQQVHHHHHTHIDEIDTEIDSMYVQQQRQPQQRDYSMHHKVVPEYVATGAVD